MDSKSRQVDLIDKNLFIYTRARFLLWSLVFSFLVIACTQAKKESGGITIQWNNEKAEAIVIPLSSIPGENLTNISSQLKVRLINNSTPVIHDQVEVAGSSVIFKPLIAFTRGLKYEVLFSDKLIGQFEIPLLSIKDLTEVVAVYPTTDTLPENALKLYIVFSKPMQEGQALSNIDFIKNEKDTLSSVFLDLAQELWNRERTTLTLWFDPGRVKRDLQPNQNLGTPLQRNNSYRLVIDKNWRDELGLTLGSGYEKKFLVGKRDSNSPDPSNWEIHPPKALTTEPLVIDMHESLDYLLLKNAVSITNSNGDILNGSFEPASKETMLRFTPTEAWKQNEYVIKFEARLEDLAGNNLNRLFDKDLTRPDKHEQQKIFTKKFRVN